MYGLQESDYERLKNYIDIPATPKAAKVAFESKNEPPIVESTPVEQINLNTATQDDFKKHPYFDWKKAKTIIAYRDNHGAFSKVDDLRKVRAISRELFEKLKPYLTVE